MAAGQSSNGMMRCVLYRQCYCSVPLRYPGGGVSCSSDVATGVQVLGAQILLSALALALIWERGSFASLMPVGETRGELIIPNAVRTREMAAPVATNRAAPRNLGMEYHTSCRAHNVMTMF